MLKQVYNNSKPYSVTKYTVGYIQKYTKYSMCVPKHHTSTRNMAAGI